MVSIPPGSSLGRYRVVDQLGRGGMATVFKCHDPNLDRYVAIKVLPSYYTEDPTFVGRFTQEAQTVARLNNPSILQIYDFGEDKGFSFIVTEMVAGGTLQDKLTGDPMSVEQVLKYMKPLVEALDYAHAQGIVHRDLKPANVLLTEDERPILADFGLARMLESATRFTQAHQALGTPEYMAPEQAMGADADHRSDLYAIGIMLYQMLLGQTPFRADTPAATLMAHVHRPLPLPTSINSYLNPRIEALLLKALAKEPDDRFQSAKDMIQALETASGLGRKTAPMDDLDFGATAVLDLSELEAATAQDIDAATLVMDTGVPPQGDTLAVDRPTQGIQAAPPTEGAPRRPVPPRAQPPATSAPSPAPATKSSGPPMALIGGGAAVAIAVIAIVAFVLSQGGGNDGQPAAASPTETSSVETPLAVVPVADATATPEAAQTAGDALCPTLPGTGDGDATSISAAVSQLNVMQERAHSSVANLRNVEDPPAVETILRTRDELCEITRGFYRRRDVRDQIFEAEELYKTLGLMAADESLEEILLEIQLQQVSALFDDLSGSVYVLSDAKRITPQLELGYASAYMGGLQQELFNVTRLRNSVRDGTGDEFRAVTALITGDVAVVSGGYVDTVIAKDADALNELRQPIPGNKLLSAPAIVQKTILFPQVAGRRFVEEIFAKDGVWDTVNQAYEAPPETTEQVLHPEKYFSLEAPHNVVLPNIAGHMSGGWSLTATDTMGEFLVRSYLEEHLSDREAADAASGWGGDRYYLMSNPEQGRLMVGQVQFDSGLEADEFFEAFRVFMRVATQDTDTTTQQVGQTGQLWTTEGGKVVFLGESPPAALLIIGDDQAAVNEALNKLGEALVELESQQP
jgi:serine/threonine-protein kinase